MTSNIFDLYTTGSSRVWEAGETSEESPTESGSPSLPYDTPLPLPPPFRRCNLTGSLRDVEDESGVSGGNDSVRGLGHVPVSGSNHPDPRTRGPLGIPRKVKVVRDPETQELEPKENLRGPPSKKFLRLRGRDGSQRLN